jgi:Helix-turn-helix domain
MQMKNRRSILCANMATEPQKPAPASQEKFLSKNKSQPLPSEPATDNPKLAAIPHQHERRWETGEELKAFIDEKELRRRLPVSRRTIHNWRRAGKIPSIVIGRRVLFCWDNVAEALRRLERGGAN